MTEIRGHAQKCRWASFFEEQSVYSVSYRKDLREVSRRVHKTDTSWAREETRKYEWKWSACLLKWPAINKGKDTSTFRISDQGTCRVPWNKQGTRTSLFKSLLSSPSNELNLLSEKSTCSIEFSPKFNCGEIPLILGLFVISLTLPHFYLKKGRRYSGT